MSRWEVAQSLGKFFWKKRKFWLFPLLLAFLILAILIILGESSVLAPLVYPF